jgi:hypothetical protein
MLRSFKEPLGILCNSPQVLEKLLLMRGKDQPAVDEYMKGILEFTERNRKKYLALLLAPQSTVGSIHLFMSYFGISLSTNDPTSGSVLGRADSLFVLKNVSNMAGNPC